MPRRKRGTLSPKIPTAELQQALNQAAQFMDDFKKRVMSAEILLYSYLKLPDSNAHQILRRLAEQRGFNWATFEADVTQAAQDRLAVDVDFDFNTDRGQQVALGSDMLYVLDEGLSLAESRTETRCGSEHTLVFLANQRAGTARLLNRYGVTPPAVEDQLPDPTLSENASIRNLVERFRAGRRPPLYRRENLLRDLVSLLSMSANRNVILVGPTGVGKAALVYTLALAITAGQGPLGVTSVVEMSEQALLDNAPNTVRVALRTARDGILFVPNIARFFGGFRAEFPEKATAELMKAFYDEHVVILGTATPGRFNDRLEGSDTINQNSHVLNVPPTDTQETTHILEALKPKFESDYALSISEDSLPVVARLAGRYLTTDPLPGAAVQLLHRTCVQVNLAARSAATDMTTPDKLLDEDDVLVATSLLTGIPVANMGADERNRYANMVEHLHRRIIGQEEAVLAVSQAVRMARVGLKDPKRPIGSFLFLGPTGVGKSELAKVLADFMFGTEEALVTLDMSEYMDESAVNRLIGSPPGYVGYEAGGQLTDVVKEKPYSIILFDEVEKAAVKVFDVLLQIMDEGRLTSGKGETVSFSDCVIIMTSNIGSRHLAKESPDMVDQSQVEEALKTHFRPEFLNRLDDIITFHALSQEDLRQILDLLLKRENRLLANRQLGLQISEAAKDWLLAQNEHPEWGARPLRRLIARHIRTPLADYLLREDPGPGVIVEIDVGDNVLTFNTRAETIRRPADV